MAEIKIEKATMKNLRDIQKLNLSLFEKEYKEYDKSLNLDWTFGKKGTKYFKERISKENGCVLITRINNEIVGYLAGGLTKVEEYRNIPQIAELENMFILEKYRGSGIGTKLYQNFIAWCKSKSIKKIKVIVSAQNIKAINFYEKNGFLEYNKILEREI